MPVQLVSGHRLDHNQVNVLGVSRRRRQMPLVEHGTAAHGEVFGQHRITKDCRNASRKAQILLNLAALGPGCPSLPGGQVGLQDHVPALAM